MTLSESQFAQVSFGTAQLLDKGLRAHYINCKIPAKLEVIGC